MDAHLQTCQLPELRPQRHPSKEAVRAWMVRRGHTTAPPPAPDEIRRELGWTRSPPGDAAAGLVCLPAFLPFVFTELAALTALAWYCLAWQAGGKKGPPIT